MTLRERLEARARDAGIPHPETLTAIQLLDAIHDAQTTPDTTRQDTDA
jgi:hypothetical protein